VAVYGYLGVEGLRVLSEYFQPKVGRKNYSILSGRERHEFLQNKNKKERKLYSLHVLSQVVLSIYILLTVNFIRPSGCLLVTDCIWVFESLPNNVHPHPHPSLPLKCHPLCSHPNFRLTSRRETLRSCGDACYAGYTPTFSEIRGNRVVNPVLWGHTYLLVVYNLALGFT